uniref:Uncharacterized protein n=1 Tax=Lepeophtheirus salmonis TaxID=72036 RepID=A0A0K2UIB4_LEPSM
MNLGFNSWDSLQVELTFLIFLIENGRLYAQLLMNTLQVIK